MFMILIYFNVSYVYRILQSLLASIYSTTGK
jgi:hypothetical protein